MSLLKNLNGVMKDGSVPAQKNGRRNNDGRYFQTTPFCSGVGELRMAGVGSAVPPVPVLLWSPAL